MIENYEYLWTTEKLNHVLINLSDNKYSIFNISNNTELIIRDNETREYVIKQMRKSGSRVIRKKLLKYLLDNRPVPTIIGFQNRKELYRCPDTGEKFELDVEYSPNVEIERELYIMIKWSSSIPLTKQIISLRRLIPYTGISTPDLLHYARINKQIILACYYSHWEAVSIVKEGKNNGLDLYITSEYP